MQNPKDNNPRKDSDRDSRKPDSASSAFNLHWRDGDHSIDGDDNTPAVAFPGKPNPPRIVIEDDAPKKYDFNPYRKDEGRMAPGFDPDDVDDIDYDLPFGPSGDYKGDVGDDDYDPRVDDPMFRIAERILPDRPDIMNTLDIISNVDFDSLVAAGIIEEEMRGKTPDKNVDRLTAAALLSGADNAYDVLDEVPKKTADLMVDFNMASAAGDPDAPQFARLSMDIQRLIIAFTAADFESLSKGLRNGTMFGPEAEEMYSAASFLVDASRNRSDKPTKGDIQLMNRAARAFNDACEMMQLRIGLQPAGEEGLALVKRSELDAPESSVAKKAANQKKNQPKPPGH